jgi:hypothetical protein
MSDLPPDTILKIALELPLLALGRMWSVCSHWASVMNTAEDIPFWMEYSAKVNRE